MQSYKVAVPLNGNNERLLHGFAFSTLVPDASPTALTLVFQKTKRALV